MKLLTARVVDLLLALGDGDSVVIDGTSWTSYEADGFEVEDLRAGDIVRVARERVMSISETEKTCEVLR